MHLLNMTMGNLGYVMADFIDFSKLLLSHPVVDGRIDSFAFIRGFADE